MICNKRKAITARCNCRSYICQTITRFAQQTRPPCLCFCFFGGLRLCTKKFPSNLREAKIPFDWNGFSSIITSFHIKENLISPQNWGNEAVFSEQEACFSFYLTSSFPETIWQACRIKLIKRIYWKRKKSFKKKITKNGDEQFFFFYINLLLPPPSVYPGLWCLCSSSVLHSGQ